MAEWPYPSVLVMNCATAQILLVPYLPLKQGSLSQAATPDVLLRNAQALGSGIMNKEKADYLGEIRDKMGLSKEAAEKIIKGVQNQHLIGNLQVSGIQH